MFANRHHARLLAMLACCAAAAQPVWAAHPLNTDDTGVQGAGNFQLELTYDDAHDNAQGVRSKTRTFATTLSYGIVDSADLIVGAPYLRLNDAVSGTGQSESGLGDASLQLKWKFYEKDDLSFVIKPGVTFRNGDVNKGLGAGKHTYSALFVTSLEREPWSWHFNLGYTRNNAVDPAAIRKNLLLVSGAFFYKATESVKLVADAGVSTNGDNTSSSHPAYVLGGVIYSPTKDVDLDLGVQFGANKVADDRVYKAGVTFRW